MPSSIVSRAHDPGLLALVLCAALPLMISPCDTRAEAALGVVPGCPSGSRPMARLELVFGAGKAGAMVGPRAWARFLATEVTPRAPDGLTVLEGYGQWRGSGRGLTRERSRLLLIWYEPGSLPEAEIEAIRSAYKRRFGQESVLRSDSTSCVSF